MTNLSVNGIDGSSGDYLLPDATVKSVARLARGEPSAAPTDDRKMASLRTTKRHLGLTLDLQDLAEAGWGVVFHREADPAVREALAPLLALRRSQAGDRYREYTGDAGFSGEESVSTWLGQPPRQKALGTVDPRKVPYYLLLIGGPDAIPFAFQYVLNVTYAVGRLAFDTPADYARHALAIVAHETLRAPSRRRMAFFGTSHPFDAATELSSGKLVEPLLAELKANGGKEWAFDAMLREKATKANFASLLKAGTAPSLLFTATHGMGYPNGHANQRAWQGALLCQDWPGKLRSRGPVDPSMFYSGDDVGDTTSVEGGIVFSFACYGGGTPRVDDYPAPDGGVVKQIAPAPFVARLPQQLLAAAGGPALAMVAHVERAWSCSFTTTEAGADITSFRTTFGELMAGATLGSAMDAFRERFAQESGMLASRLDDIRLDAHVSDDDLASNWTAQRDARSFVLFGDPAVRLHV
ncbi:hypothetical protein BJI69_05595 [Luteibacter rhizovicinus DSM 16549]|uniref:Uncharacterized protein n=1 Tax=Luteibacter rhizovicinus DSM 16549 TaxID=1440763 RepID=A0A0G9HEV5_9GAMM|nr:C25 family cysteine peptidase [Luteibacter rhizovicinus]APG03442.1 hypothetical protein BJI69_05595 [Luteibacter rhizovicinus DSM 16549]KLD68076.1 hypothetical protein Y883_04240 [Luteibacter rhizovicinus DSM 16549]KLD77241.1 hypothetical protein Y886_16945 [Xanthomonas hyacinthi DSM 19077]